MELEKLPDYPILKQLADSLWEVGDTRGAAVMVGAGFSRNAKRLSPISVQPPLWDDFKQAMQEKLPATKSIDVLDLAQQYEEMYGRVALDGLIRNLVKDEEWEPDNLHAQLLDLPWNDILTTNWDTLLERSVINLRSQKNYEIINVPSDISRTRSPRIVKLHGSLPSYTPFIFTAEDYKSYEKKFAPFVNLARQVLLENDLCLIGFSGDDPNFKQWMKWVKTVLDSSARRIFLVGFLEPSIKDRKHFKKRNIIPIDFSPLFKGKNLYNKHQESIRLFLDFLHDSKPKPQHEWPDQELYKVLDEKDQPILESERTSRDPKCAAARIQEKLPLLQRLRKSYPGWLVCPDPIRSKISRLIPDVFSVLDKSKNDLGSKEIGESVYLFVWAHDIAYQPISVYDKKFLEEVMRGKLSDSLTNSQHFFIAQFLLRTAREDDDQDSYSYWETWLTQHGNKETVAYLAFQRCLQARNALNYQTIIDNIQEIKGDDPAWQLRRAGFYAELGKTEKAIGLIRDTTFELQKRREKDRKNIWILSRLAWAAMLSKELQWISHQGAEDAEKNIFETEKWPADFKENHCDPFDELNSIEKNIDKHIKEKREEKQSIHARFDSGDYSDDSKIIKFSGPEYISPNYQPFRIFDEIALPIAIDNLGIIKHKIQKNLHFAGWNTLSACFSNIRILLYADEKELDKYLSRVRVSTISKAFISEIADKLEEVILFYAEQIRNNPKNHRSFLSYRLQAATELLSRFVGRLPPEKAEAVFIKACDDLSGDLRYHFFSYNSITNLLKRSLLAIPPERRDDYILNIIRLPLAAELPDKEKCILWPELINEIPFRNPTRDIESPVWKQRITEIIQVIGNEAEGLGYRNKAILRLFYLNESNLLSLDEKKCFAQAVRHNKEEKRVFQETGLFAYIYLMILAPVDQDVRNLLQVYYNFSRKDRPSLYDLIAIQGAALLKEKPLLPTKKQASSMLDYMLTLSPLPESDSNLFEWVGPTIADAILPVFSTKDWSDGLTEKMMTWIQREDIPSALQAAPQLVRLDDKIISTIESQIRRALFKRDKNAVHAALSTINRWINMGVEGYPKLPENLARGVVSIVSNLRYPKLHASLYIARLLVENSLINDDDINLLIYALEDLETEAAYANWNQEHAETHNLPFVRRNCILLAKAMMDNEFNHAQCQRWLEIMKDDPLPEVRYVLSEASE